MDRNQVKVVPSKPDPVSLINVRAGQLFTHRLNLVSSSTGVNVYMALKNPYTDGYKEAFYCFTKNVITDLAEYDKTDKVFVLLRAESMTVSTREWKR